MLTGYVTTHFSNYYYAQTDDGTAYQCFVRALLKKEQLTVLAGDQVYLQPCDSLNSGGSPLPTAWITGILPRRNTLKRPKIANVDQVLVLHPISPTGQLDDLLALDRTLLHINLAGLPAIICLSKMDLLANPADWDYMLAVYQQQLGYTVLPTTIYNDQALNKLMPLLAGKTTVLAGVSGAGKSSLLNVVSPELDLKTAERLTAMGSHTTRHVHLLPLDDNGWVADTPGFRLQSFNRTNPALLSAALPEASLMSTANQTLKDLQATCGFDDCLHMDETDCPVRPTMDAKRYHHYRQFQAEAAEYRQTVLATSQKTEGATKTLDRGGKQIQIARLKSTNRTESRRKRKQVDIYDPEME